MATPDPTVLQSILSELQDVVGGTPGIDGRTRLGSANRIDPPAKAGANLMPTRQLNTPLDGSGGEDDDDFGTWDKASPEVSWHECAVVVELIKGGPESLAEIIALASAVGARIENHPWSTLAHSVEIAEQGWATEPQDRPSKPYAISAIAVMFNYATRRGKPSRSAL